MKWLGTGTKEKGSSPFGFQEPATVQSVMEGGCAGITMDRPRIIVDVNLILRSGTSILLGRRRNTDFANGCYSLPAGHLELGESVVDALIREAKEEAGIFIDPSDVRFVQVMHNSYGIGRFAMFFEVRRWVGEVCNMEARKCDDLSWFDLGALPDNMVPYIRKALADYVSKRDAYLTLYGW